MGLHAVLEGVGTSDGADGELLADVPDTSGSTDGVLRIDDGPAVSGNARSVPVVGSGVSAEETLGEGGLLVLGEELKFTRLLKVEVEVTNSVHVVAVGADLDGKSGGRIPTLGTGGREGEGVESRSPTVLESLFSVGLVILAIQYGLTNVGEDHIVGTVADGDELIVAVIAHLSIVLFNVDTDVGKSTLGDSQGEGSLHGGLGGIEGGGDGVGGGVNRTCGDTSDDTVVLIHSEALRKVGSDGEALETSDGGSDIDVVHVGDGVHDVVGAVGKDGSGGGDSHGVELELSDFTTIIVTISGVDGKTISVVRNRVTIDVEELGLSSEVETRVTHVVELNVVLAIVGTRDGPGIRETTIRIIVTRGDGVGVDDISSAVVELVLSPGWPAVVVPPCVDIIIEEIDDTLIVVVVVMVRVNATVVSTGGGAGENVGHTNEVIGLGGSTDTVDLDGNGDRVGVGEVLSEESNSAVNRSLKGLVSSNVGVDRTLRKVESVLLDAVDVDEDTVGGLDINLDHGSVGHEIGGKGALNLVVAGQGRHGGEGADEVRGPGSGEGGVGGPGLIGLGNVGVLPEGARGNDGTSVEGDLLSGEAVESTLNNDKVGLVGQLEARAVTPAVLAARR